MSTKITCNESVCGTLAHVNVCEFIPLLHTQHYVLCQRIHFPAVVRIVDKSDKFSTTPRRVHIHTARASSLHGKRWVDRKFSFDLAFYFHTGRSHSVLNSVVIVVEANTATQPFVLEPFGKSSNPEAKHFVRLTLNPFIDSIQRIYSTPFYITKKSHFSGQRVFFSEKLFRHARKKEKLVVASCLPYVTSLV